MTRSKAEQQVVDGSAWDAFCDALKDAGKIVRSDKAPDDPFNQAEGYRYLTRLLRGGLESSLEFRDPLFPQLRCGAHETIKLGADNPDNRYEIAIVDPRHDYRITGTRGTVDYLSFASVINRYGRGGGMQTTGFLDSQDLEIAADGALEIIVSQAEHPGNWLPMAPDTNSVNVRQTFQDRVSEKRAELKIERIGAESERPAPLTAEQLIRGLQGAVRFVTGSAALFEDWAESFVPNNNTLPAATPTSSTFTAAGRWPMTRCWSSRQTRSRIARPGISSSTTGGWNRWITVSARFTSTSTRHTMKPMAAYASLCRTWIPACQTGLKPRDMT